MVALNCSNHLAIAGGSQIVPKGTFGYWPMSDESEKANLIEVLNSRQWGGIHTNGFVNKFETAFSRYHADHYALLVSSGTSALVMSLLALGIQPGDEVIVPTMSFIATATAVSLVRATPVFVDIDQFQCIDLNAAEVAYTSKTKAIIVVHMAGHPCNMDVFIDFARRKKIYIIEDCAQALGATWNNRLVGTFGDIGCFSFAETKNITAGEGGLLLTSKKQLYEKLRALQNHGRFAERTTYTHERLGANYRMSEFQAAVLLAQFYRLECQLEKKNRFATQLLFEIENLKWPWIDLVRTHEKVTCHGYYSLSFLYRAESFHGIPKNVFIYALQAEGIPVGSPNFAPHGIHRNPIYSDPQNPNYCANIQHATPVCDEKYQRLIIMGQAIHSAIMFNLGNIEYLLNALKKLEKNWEQLLKIKID